MEKHTTLPLARFYLLFSFLTLFCLSLPGFSQLTISRFDYNSLPLTTASIGPNSLSIDPDAVTDGTGGYIIANCNAVKGLDLDIPNPGGLFDVPELGMSFNFQRDEAFANFFTRGGTSFYIAGNQLFINYRTTDGGVGFIDYGPFNTGYTVIDDERYREYNFEYTAANGLATVSVGGVQVWSNDGPDGRDLYWVGAGNISLCTIMDGNCNGKGIIDWSIIYVPSPLPVEFLSFDGEAINDQIALNWTTSNEMQNDHYNIEKSADGITFEIIDIVYPAGNDPETEYSYEATDYSPKTGYNYYRIVQFDHNGSETMSPTIEVLFEPGSGASSLTIYPNPSRGNITLDIQSSTLSNKIEVVNSHGTLVQQAELVPGKHNLKLENLNPGIYFIYFRDNTGTQMKRLILL